MQNKDELELIAHSLNGDHDAYGVLVDRYKNAIFYHCFAIVHDEASAEDVAQETFITAYYKLHLYNADYRLSTWLFKIATNKALDSLRKHRHEIKTDDNVFDTLASQQPGPDKSAHYDELHRAVEALAPKHRAVISLYYWQGLSYDEIANVMSVPVGSVQGWMHRAKATLRKELS